jgi:hypothetical protein
MALRVYDLSGRKEEHLSESLEWVHSATIREAAARSTRSRQHRKLQTMLIGSTDDVDGLIPDTADNLCAPESKRRFRFDPLRGL